jgi:pimeloyl-ACP methyl ester carboxylesterase
MFFFLSPTAEIALPLDDYTFIDHLWRDWSPGYEGTWDVARVKESIGDPEHIIAAIGYYRAMWDPALQAPELSDEQAAALMPTPKPTLYLHGRDDNCMLLSSIGSPLDFLAEGSEVEIVDDTGHFLHVEQPEVVNRRIVRFLTT